MKKRLIDLRGFESPLLDIVSLGRVAPRVFSAVQRQQVARTVGRHPEVIVKVSGGARTLGGVEQHMAYIGRNGEFAVELDTGERLQERHFERSLVLEWNLDLEAQERQNAHRIREGRKPSKLVHNLIFSMPPGTPASKVLRAVKILAANEFELKHRYAMVLHADEPHPHVHVVVKAVSEQGVRLNIRKATLRNWRRQFAENLRQLGVAANATERAVRGQSRSGAPDGIYRADRRHESTVVRAIEKGLVAERAQGSFKPEPGRATLIRTRQSVVDGWRAIAEQLQAEGDWDLAHQVDRFVQRMAPVQTDREAIAQGLRPSQRVRKPMTLERTR
jgi:hypothetical protein